MFVVVVGVGVVLVFGLLSVDVVVSGMISGCVRRRRRCCGDCRLFLFLCLLLILLLVAMVVVVAIVVVGVSVVVVGHA